MARVVWLHAGAATGGIRHIQPRLCPVGRQFVPRVHVLDGLHVAEHGLGVLRGRSHHTDSGGYGRADRVLVDGVDG